MRVIGLDLGKRRSGIAVSDELGVLAHPHSTVDDPDHLLEAIRSLAQAMGAELVVVGLPIGAGGGDTDQTQWVRERAAEIEARLGLRVVLWDERVTTKEAERRLSEVGRGFRTTRYLAEVAAAAIILQSYLDATREGGRSGRPT